MLAQLFKFTSRKQFFDKLIYIYICANCKMGVCPSLSPQQRSLNQQNEKLRLMLEDKIKDLGIYRFSAPIKAELPLIQKRYLYNLGILQDIESIMNIAVSNISIKTESIALQVSEQQLRNSCLIMEDEVLKQKNQCNANNGNENQYIVSIHQNIDYQKCLKQNQSLVCQMNIIYQKDLDIKKYHRALKLFLKFSSIFHQHFYGGFLKPVIRTFCQMLYRLPTDDLDTIVDQTSVFVQFMVSVYTQVYQLKALNEGDNGCLFKNQNVYNLIMSHLFKKTKIKVFIRKSLQQTYKQKIQKFKRKLEQYSSKEIDFFGVDPKFQLKQPTNIDTNQSNSSINVSMNIDMQKSNEYPPLVSAIVPQPITSAITPGYCISAISYMSLPYGYCIKPIITLCQNAQTPITKLKLIVEISKCISAEIYRYYDRIQKQVPDLDPDNLTSIIMYLIAKANKPQLFEQLKIAQLFTTINCLSCISGYYLNTFNAAIETIITVDKFKMS